MVVLWSNPDITVPCHTMAYIKNSPKFHAGEGESVNQTPLPSETSKTPPSAASESQHRTNTVSVGPAQLGSGTFSVIAGPCAIESEAQFEETALAVKQYGAVLLRGGIWKMRTSHKTFQGLGDTAFDFVREVLARQKMKLVTEVTDPRQIEQIDDFTGMYQVGARNMFNYALLKELGKTQKPILLKRSFSALCEEWFKAADYIVASGNDKVVLCERGIRTFETATRFTFDLNAVLIAKTKTNFPVVVDPSHAIGIAEYVPKLALAAAAVGADGIIVEVHPRPTEALSDGQQALTVENFRVMMTQIKGIVNSLGREMQRLETHG